MQVMAYSWQIDGVDGWTAPLRENIADVTDVMLDMWKLLPDPIACATVYALTHTVLQYPHLCVLLQDVSSHAFVGSTFTFISPSFNSDISAVALAVYQALPALQSMNAFDIFRSITTDSTVVSCVLECCFRAWGTMNRMLKLEHDTLLAVVDTSASHAHKRQPNHSGMAQAGCWESIAASIDPLLVWSDHYVRSSDYASGGTTAHSSCPSPCASAFMSLPSCHLTILGSSISLIITLCEDTPAFKTSIMTNPQLIKLAKSAICQYSELSKWMDLVRAFVFYVCHCVCVVN
jgi:hypothetical protein